MKTPRLYWDDPLLLDFASQVIDRTELDGRPALVLRETAFCPEAGGQLADRGEASWDGGAARVVDAQEDDEGRVLHVLETSDPLPPPGTAIRIRIDAGRRRAHMSQHTGQHMLSRALLDVAGAPTVSSRLGETICTIDVTAEQLTDEQLADAETLVAKVVLEDRPVRAFVPTPEELATLPLRRDPKVSRDVRIIDVEGFDLSPCGGTHVQRTGQVGALRILGTERYKGGTRITFATGLRALRDAARKDRILRELSAGLTCGIDELPQVIARMQADRRDEHKAAAALRERLARYVGDELLAKAASKDGVRWVVATLPDEPIESLRAIGARIAETPDAVAILASPAAAATRILVHSGVQSGVGAGALLQRIAQAAGGRGGGRPDRAEGQIPAGVDLAAIWSSLG